MDTKLQPTEHQPKPHRLQWRSTLSTVGIVLLAPLLVLFLTSFVFQSYQVSGESMQNTLQNNDRLLVWKGGRNWDHLLGKQYVPKRGNIVIVAGNNFSGCLAPSGDIVKRVIGLPGERVTFHQGHYKIYNASSPAGFDPDQSLPYGSTGTAEFTDTQSADTNITLSSTQLFISGDHRAASCDSRVFGPIQTSQVVGKLVVRLLPLSKAERF